MFWFGVKLNMSKIKKFFIVLVVLILLRFTFIKLYQINPIAEYIYDDTESIIAIKFKNQVYEYMTEPPKPYYFIYDEDSLEFKNYLVLYNELSDFFFPPCRVYFYTDYYDTDKNFLRCNVWSRPSDDFFVKESFTYPSLDKNPVDEIWMTHTKTNKIEDTETVDKIVECVKSEGEIALDKEIVDYIKKYSWDNHCFYLKYEGYPLVEEFHIEETEDGRYIVDQFTAEEYDTIYWDEH